MAKRKHRAARAAYPSDLTDAQWALIPPAEPGGRERSVDMHEIFNGIVYVLRSGCSCHFGNYLRMAEGYLRMEGIQL
jgi:hypothetical protein